jgi:uncharacterized protein (AIM24 family)
MFELQTVNELACVAVGNDVLYAKKGAMIAYQGEFSFSKLILGPGDNLMQSAIRHVTRRLSGENMELMEVKGQGSCYFAELAKHAVVVNLNQGDRIGVESENLLAFTSACDYGVRFIGSGIISQKGLFTSNITAKGPGAQICILSDGNPIMLQTPCVVDPDAVICWTGADPSFKLGLNWKTFLGQTSGESYMLEFKNAGQTVIIQPSERKSGLSIGIDDRNYTPQTQGASASQNSAGGSGGGFGNILGNILGGR